MSYTDFAPVVRDAKGNFVDDLSPVETVLETDPTPPTNSLAKFSCAKGDSNPHGVTH